MTKLNAGTPVKSGYYFSTKTWTIVPVEKDGTVLEGAAGEQFVPLPLLVAVTAAPVLGAGFLMFMPFIGFAMFAKAVARPVTKAFQKSTAEIAASVSPGMVPGEAYLTGKEGKAEAKGATEEKELDALQAEIDAKRSGK